jgi:hypothetical protein
MSALMDIWHTIQAVVTSADYWTLGAAILVVIVAGFIMEGLGSLISATVMSLLIFALLKFAIAMTVGGQHDAEALALSNWQAFVDLKMLTLLAYAITFGVLIAVVNLIRSAIR